LERLDLRGIPCPANAAKALIRIATMDAGERLEIWLNAGEHLENLVPAVEQEGHRVVERNPIDGEAWSVVIEVAG
jgi:sulfite reductase (ferredoxin)